MKFAIWRLSLTSNMTRRRRFAIKWSYFDFRKLVRFQSLAKRQNCLIGSIDLLYRNSWNEVRTLHFNGEQAMIEALENDS